MANVYEGKPDGRQSNDMAMATSRFRPRYRALTDDEKALHDEIKTKAEELEQLYLRVKQGRYHSLALTSLEESVMWIVKELTA
jgi:ABC-type phosphate transport system auxiliary subunit